MIEKYAKLMLWFGVVTFVLLTLVVLPPLLFPGAVGSNLRRRGNLRALGRQGPRR